jgi:hypothetical protein
MYEDMSEDLTPYFENMSPEQLNWSLKEEEYNRSRFGYKCKSDFTLNKFR